MDLLLRLSVPRPLRLASYAARVLPPVKLALLVALEPRLLHQSAVALVNHRQGLGV